MEAAFPPPRVPPVNLVENHFNYFTEIEERYLQRRGGGLLLSTLDWALIETWKNAGVPLEAALRGIDATFDRYEQRPSKTKKINSLAFCSQEVLAAAEDMKEAAEGEAVPQKGQGQGFEPQAISLYLLRNAAAIENADLPTQGAVSVKAVAKEIAKRLQDLAPQENKFPRLEDLERHLTVLEEKLLAALLAATPDDQLVRVRAEADRDLQPYRRNMAAAQIDQLHKQYLHKRLLERYRLPRLSLFYM
ncbi:MAG TPA: hypothetical protein VFO39_17730 [Candidatus Sulfotelmatobacter sp.]|nr:hypothetical protein [Candidatus Sulfotelmatobacter sp.]